MGLVARWAAVAALAAGVWVGSAREAWAADDTYYSSSAPSGGKWDDTKAWYYPSWGDKEQSRPDAYSTINYIHFDNNHEPTMKLNNGWYSVQTISFEAGTAARTINQDSGSEGIDLYGGIYNHVGEDQTFNVPISLKGNSIFQNSWATLTFSKDIYTGTGGDAKSLTFQANDSGSPSASATTLISGVISQAGSLTKNSITKVVLSGANTYTGTTTVNNGVLEVQNAKGLGTTAGGTTVASGGTLALSGGVAVQTSEAIGISGSGYSSGGALKNISGNNSCGTVTISAANARVHSDAGELTIATLATGGNAFAAEPASGATIKLNSVTGAGTINKGGAGTLYIKASSSIKQLNLYDGTVELGDGTLTSLVLVNQVNSSGTTLKLNGATTVRSVDFANNGCTVEMDVASASECETLSTDSAANACTFSIGAATTLKLSPASGYTFDATAPAVWKVFDCKRNNGSIKFTTTSLANLNLDTTAFGSVAGTFTKRLATGTSGIADAAIEVVYTPAAGAPEVTVAGVDANSFLVNWTDTEGTGVYNVQLGTSDPLDEVLADLEEDFSGWTTESDPGKGTTAAATAKNVLSKGHTFTLGTDATDGYRQRAWVYNRTIAPVGVEIYTGYRKSYIMTDVITGSVSKVEFTLRSGGATNVYRRLSLQVMTNGVGSWATLGDYYPASNTDINTCTYIAPVPLQGGTAGLRFRLYRSNTDTTTEYSSHIRSWKIYGRPGHSERETGLAANTTYRTRVRERGGLWSDTLTVKTGVIPATDPSMTTRGPNSVTISWSAAPAGVTGYEVQATTQPAPDAWGPKNVGTESLTNTFGAKEWKYIGVDDGFVSTPSSSTVKVSPTYYNSTYHHSIAGKAGLGIQSIQFPIAGMTSVKIGYSVGGLNLNQTGGTLENGRVEAYYQIDNGPWCFLGTALPTATSTGSWNPVEYTVPQGALDGGKTIAFKVVAPNAKTSSSSSYCIGPFVKNLAVTRLSKGSGDYSGTDSGGTWTDYPVELAPGLRADTTTETSYTVTGLPTDTPVYYRVRALQGSNVKSIWREGTSRTLVAQTVEWTAQPAGVAMLETTIVAAEASQEDAAIKYSSSDTGVAVVDEDTGVVTPVSVGTTTITATSQATTHYPAGTTASYTFTVRPARPTSQATLSLNTGAGTRTTTTFSLDFKRGGGTGVLILVKKDGWPNNPTDGVGVANITAGSSALTATSYGDAYAVVNNTYANNNSHTKPVTGATAGSHYFARAFTYNNSGLGDASDVTYTYMTPGAGCDFWTLATAPGSAATVSGAATGSDTATITYNANGAGNILLVVMPDASKAEPTVNGGTKYAADLEYGKSGYELGTGYVVYAGAAGSGSQTVDITGLRGGTDYVVYAFPYNTATGDSGGTSANYGSATLSAKFTTDTATGPTGLSATSGRNWITATWTGVEGATYNLQITACGGSEAWSTVSTCANSDKSRYSTAQTGSSWYYLKADTSGWPSWGTDSADSTAGHQLMTTAGTPNPKVALCSPTLDLRDYTEGKVEFKHWSRHKSAAYYTTQSRVTLYYRTSTDGSTWSDWTAGATTADLTETTKNYATCANESMEIPAAALGKRYVQIKLSADGAKTYSGPINTGPKLSDVVVSARNAGGNYDSCATYLETDITGQSALTYTFTGLPSAQQYFFRVQAVVGGVPSAWTEGTAETTAFEGPTGVAVTGTTRYTLTAEWDKYSEAGYATSYNVKLSECGGAESGPVAGGTCADSALSAGPSDGAWSYRMSKSTGGTTGVWPQYKGGGHALRAAQSSIAEAPGVVSPLLDMSGYTGGKISFNVWSFVNDSRYFAGHTKVYLHYRTKEGGGWGAWSAKSETYSAAAATTGTSPGTAREIALPPESLTEAVQYMLSADDAAVVDLGEAYDPRYVNPGPVLKGIAIEGESSGTGDFSTSGCVVESHDGVAGHAAGATGKASYTFGEAPNAALVPGKTYYVQVETVLTKSGDTATSRGSEAKGTTLAQMAPPAEVWAEDIKQKHMTVVWTAAEGADADTRYMLQVTGCSAGTTSETPVHEASTAGRLTTEDDWTYVGGGTPTGAEEVTLENGTTVTKATEVGADGIAAAGGGETYPAYAGNDNDQSHVLAGYGEPGIETLEFSTVGATAGLVTFKHARWFNGTSALSTHSSLELSYSTDGGTSWTAFDSKPGSAVQSYGNAKTGVSQSSALPAGALGQPRVKVRIVATNATVANTGTSASPVWHALGAQVREAKVSLTKTVGNYDSCGTYAPQTFEGLTAEQLEKALGDSPALTENTQYYFHVAASDGKRTLSGGGYAYGAWTDGTAKTLDVPAKPAAPTLSNVGRTTMTVTWTEAERAETYKVYVYDSAGTSLVAGPFDAGSALTYQLTGLTKGTTYKIAVSGCADGTEGPLSDKVSQAMNSAFKVGALVATNVLDTSMTLTWSAGGNVYNRLTFFEEDGTGDDVTETIACPAKTLARTDSGNGWYYVGGSASYPAYWANSGNAADQGHALIYNGAGQPGIRSRWFSTFGVTEAVVDFWHGRFNKGADSAVTVEYSLDGGATWTYAGQAPSTSASTPTEHRQIKLPAAALGRRSVMVQLTASGASGNLGAHVKDLKVTLTGPKGAQKGDVVDVGTSQTSYTKTGLTAGKRYWVKLESRDSDGGTSDDSATLVVTTRTKQTGVLASQGFEGSGERSGLDTEGWTCSIQYIQVDGGGTRTPAQRLGTDPKVEVVYGENPLYGDRALRMSSSKAGDVFGVADFTYPLDSRGGVVTIPFSAKDLKKNDYLYVAYKRGSGAWTAPAGLATTTTMGNSVTMGRIGVGGDDVMNQNWPYNRGKNTTTRPGGDAFTFEAAGSGDLTVRVAFCGQGGTGADSRYYYIDELLLEEAAGTPSPASATANADGTVTVTWTPPRGQDVIVVRGRDQRTPPWANGVDLSAVPEGYEVLYYNAETHDPVWPNSVATLTDSTADSGWKYFYYIYAKTSSGAYGKTPALTATDGTGVYPFAVVKGTVHAIASMGWDGWDAHPWSYRQGRVSNPGRSSDAGYWKANGMNSANVAFFHENAGDIGETDGDTGGTRPVMGQSDLSGFGTAPTYASIYGQGGTYGTKGYADDDATKQQGLSSYTNYFGKYSYRFSGGGGYVWKGSHTYVDWAGNTVTSENPVINTNNPAIEFANVDLSGYKNVEFQMHYAGPLQGGGNYLHLAISTNGGAPGTWQAIDNLDSSGWRVKTQAQDYGLQVQEMYSGLTGAKVDFYSQELAQYGNPFVLQVPDSVTQFMARVMFYDSNGRYSGYWRNAAIFIDEVRLLGEVALETPHPVITDNGKNELTVRWAPVEDATGYNVRITAVPSNGVVKLAESFALAATPDGWTDSGAVAYHTTGSHSGAANDYGAHLDANNEWIASPAVGAATSVVFYAKASATASGNNLIVETLEENATEWETVATIAASTITTGWTKQDVALPYRQWQKIRFRFERSGAELYIDDISIYGSGDYRAVTSVAAGSYGSGVKCVTGVTVTNFTYTGLTAGTRYYAEVQAYGAPNGVSTTSGWGETADYTTGDFNVVPDGFEMTRMTWDAAGGGMVVIAVDKGTDPSAVKAPSKSKTAASFTSGAAYTDNGSTGAHVVWAGTTGQSSPGREFVSPYDEDHPEADFVVYWKRGTHWEGRLQTNVALGTYVCKAADAIAVTNATSGSAVGTYSAGEGKGWSGGWALWDMDSAAESERQNRFKVVQDNLIDGDHLHGAGGNMLRFNMGTDNANRSIRARRQLASAYTGGDVWIMATLRTQSGASSANNGMYGIQLMSGSGHSTIFASIGKMNFRYSDAACLALNTRINGDNGIPYAVDPDDGQNKYWWGKNRDNSRPYELSNGNPHTLVAHYNVTSGRIWVKAYYTPDTTFARDMAAPTDWDIGGTDGIDIGSHNLAAVMLMGYGKNGNLDFDEVRIGDSWPHIVGLDEPAPFPVTRAEAWADGNELVRISWTYDGSREDSTLVPAQTRPLAESGVRIEWKDVDASSWTQIYEGTGTNGTVAAGGVSRWDHVVAPGTTNQYRVIAIKSKPATPVNAKLLGSDPATYDIATGVYGATEYLDTISYTNSRALSANTWKGGHGFGDTPSAWIKGDENGTWSAVNPEEAYETVHITAAHSGAKAVAGNVLKVTGLGNDKTSTIYRQLGGSAWCPNSGDAFYAAFRMGYQKIGYTRAGLVLTDSGGNHVWVGKARGADGDYRKRMGIEVIGGSGAGWAEGKTMEPYSNVDSQGGTAANAYLIVVKMQRRSENGRADISAWQFKIGVDELPENEPNSHANYGNAPLANVAKLEFTAGGESGVSIGEAFFDDLRFGTSWDDIIGATEPTDAWTLGGAKTTGYYLGDTVRWPFGSTPKGAKQHAWVSLSTSASFPAGASTKTNETSWLQNEPNAVTGPNTIWQGDGLLLWQEGAMYAGGSVKGELVTKNSWQRTAADGGGKYRYDTYTVSPIPVPTSQSAVGGTAKVTLGWTKGTGYLPDGAVADARTFNEVMVVRFSGADAATAATTWAPTQGETYLKGTSYTRNGVAGHVVYRGTDTGFEDKGLTKNTTYYYAFYTVNNSYYSTGVTAYGTTGPNDPPVVIDGNTDDWVGIPSEVKNSSTISSGEYIWTDKVGDARHDTPAAFDSDLKEFRVKVSDDGQWVYFLARLNRMDDATKPYISVAMVTNGVDATQLATEGNDPGENWIGDESDTFMGGGLFEPASLHYADVQMAVHKVQQSGTWTWQLEVYTKDDTRWHEPVSTEWSVQGSDGPSGAGASDPCVEWKVRREDLGIGVASGQLPVRFTVATFVNGGGWNNDTVATAEVGAGKTHAVDTLGIAPWSQNDKDLALTAWDEGLRDKAAHYWVDLWFGHGAVHNAKPNAPTLLTPANYVSEGDAKTAASPMMTWTVATDAEEGTSHTTGFVVGYLVEVSTNNLFNGLEGTTENGPVSLRVNLEGASTTSYRFQTDSREYWWRVRARDNSGALSDPTPWHYVVEGKTDNEGPVAKLLYVGPEVMKFINNTDGYRDEEELSGDATSVLDSELEDGGHNFGFVIEWYDVNGVYATNHARALQSGESYPSGMSEGGFAYNILAEHGDGTVYGRVSPNWDLVIVERTVTEEEWTKKTSGNPSTGGYYEKTTSTRYVPTEDTTPGSGKHYYVMKGGSYRDVGDTTGKNPYELGWSEARESATYKRSADTSFDSKKEYYTRKSEAPVDELVGGDHHYYQWEENYTLPTEDGGFEIVNRWLVDCGKDAVFTNGAANVTETINDGNSGQYLTNFVRNAFSIGNYRPTLDIYLTLSAEDGCTRGEYREMEWYTPPIEGRDADGKNPNNGSWAPGPIPSDGKTSSGWCSDYPNPARNVTVNQLIKIPVRDNDTTPPVTSMAKWRTEATDAAGEKMYPMVAVATGTGSGANSDANEDSRSAAWNPSWANLNAGGLTRLPTYEGQGRGLQWHLTDGDVAEGGVWKSSQKLNLFFNVYDEYVHGGMKYGTTESNMVTKTIGTGGSARDVERGLFNTGFLLKDWKNNAWTAGTNWARFNRGLSSIIRQGATPSSVNTEHVKGTDPTTVLAWTLPVSQDNVEALLERKDILSAIGTDGDTGDALVVSNALKLYAFDADNNAWGDQASAELEFGQIIFTDDDGTAPVTPGYKLLGTGTNFVHFGPVAKWIWNDSGVPTATPLMNKIVPSATVAGYASRATTDATGDSAETPTWGTTEKVYYFNNVGGTAYRSSGAKYFQFTVAGTENTMWSVDTLGFKSRVSPTGPTNFTLTVQAAGGTVSSREALIGGSASAAPTLNTGWTKEGGSLVFVSSPAAYKNRVRMTDAGGTAILYSPEVNLKNYRVGTVSFNLARYNGTSSGTLTVDYSTDGGTTWSQIDPAASYTPNKTDFPDTGTSASGWTAKGLQAFDLPAALMGTDTDIRVRWKMTSCTSVGFDLSNVTLALRTSNNRETVVATVEVEKNFNDAGGFAETETDVTMGFGGMTLVNSDNAEFTFRLYGFGGSQMVDSHVTPASSGTWGINNLYLHGIASEPKKDEVTDHDLRTGGWTNHVEVMDGWPAGYDTVRSGLTVSGDNAPSFTLRYPDKYGTDKTPSLSDAEVTTGTYNLWAAASAAYDTVPNGEFTSAPGGWTLSTATVGAETVPTAEITTANGGRLTLLDSGTQSYATRTMTLQSKSDAVGLTVSGVARLYAATATGSGGVNGVEVLVELLNSSDVVRDSETFSWTIDKSWKNYTIGPWGVTYNDEEAGTTYDDVAKVRVTIQQELAAGTEIRVSELTVNVAQWGADIVNTEENRATWNANVYNGMPGAKLLAGTTPMSLRTTIVPLTKEITTAPGEGESNPYYYPESDGLYTMQATVWDADGDRTGDAMSVSVSDKFELWDDDEVAPTNGSMFGGPFGVFVKNKLIPAKQRTGTGKAQRWPVTDETLTSMEPGDEVLLTLNYYDYSGWNTTTLTLGGDAIQTAGALADTATYSQPVDLGAEGVPSATNTWATTAGKWYNKYKTAFGTTAGAEKTVHARIDDHDDDRALDSEYTEEDVGSVWFTDQDVNPPVYGNQWSQLFAGVLLATNVPDYATMKTIPAGGVGAYAHALGGSLAAHQTHTSVRQEDENGDPVLDKEGNEIWHYSVQPTDVSNRRFTIYDSQLRETGQGENGKFVVSVNMNDPTEGYKGRSPTGVRRGDTKTETRNLWTGVEGYADSWTITNTYVTLETEATNGTVKIDGSANFGGDTWCESVGSTRNAMQPGYMSWVWDTFSRATVSSLLPSGDNFATYFWRVHAYDADTNRPSDQACTIVNGPKMTVRDDDTVAPGVPSEAVLWQNGARLAKEGEELNRNTVPWVNTLEGLSVHFVEAADGDGRQGHGGTADANGDYDLVVSGIGQHRWANPGSDTLGPSSGAGLTTASGTITEDGHTKKSASLSVSMNQGWGEYRLFAVDADDDRDGDALAGTALGVPLGYDTTPPTKVPVTGANTLTVDDPTTQMDVAWTSGSVGPDDPSNAAYTTAGYSGNDSLSPWETYKVYYRALTPAEIAAVSAISGDVSRRSHIYDSYISGDKYKGESWTAVTRTSEIKDTSHGDYGYAGLHEKGTGSVRVFDLDFDQEYVFVVVGVDKAGNEGAADESSWATNNTIKFAVTQGLVRASASINAEFRKMVDGEWKDFTTAEMDALGMKRIPTTGDNAPTKGAVLYWKAAGMEENKTTHRLEGEVTKYYDLIYRDAPSFNERGTEVWSNATSGANSGTSKTNWNYQADAGLGTPGRLRFYRASYSGRWQDAVTNAGTVTQQTPLASEEVYSMNNIVLSEGNNYVSLQGVPYTNTFRGVFGVDKDVWPPDATEPTSTNGAVVVEFYESGTGAEVQAATKEQYFFAKDGEWYRVGNTDTPVTDTLQDPDFFMRPFSINLPSSNMTVRVTEGGEEKDKTVEVEWWKTHNDNKDNALKARAGSRTNLNAMVWHPILQVPTNGVVAASSEASPSAGTTARDGTGGSGLVFKQTIRRGKGVYNTLSFNLPVAVNPGDLGLVAFGTDGKPTSEKMKAGAPQDKKTDKLYVIDTVSKEVRGNTTMYCDGNGDWRYNSNRALVTGNVIKPNDMIVLISGEKESGAADEWIWEYKPADFYAPPNRHMGRDRQ